MLLLLLAQLHQLVLSQAGCAAGAMQAEGLLRDRRQCVWRQATSGKPAGHARERLGTGRGIRGLAAHWSTGMARVARWLCAWH